MLFGLAHLRFLIASFPPLVNRVNMVIATSWVQSVADLFQLQDIPTWASKTVPKQFSPKWSSPFAKHSFQMVQCAFDWGE
jgi:hypothetical protein